MDGTCHAVVSKVMKFGNKLVIVGEGLYYYAESPDSGPEGLGVRLQLTF